MILEAAAVVKIVDSKSSDVQRDSVYCQKRQERKSGNIHIWEAGSRY